MQKEQKIVPAKLCYSHIGGTLGGMLKDLFVAKKWMVKVHPSHKHYYLTETGIAELTKLGLDLTEIKTEPISSLG